MHDKDEEHNHRTDSATRRSDMQGSVTIEETSPSSGRKDSRTSTETPPKKKRKVNHACIYCRRSHMTCDSNRPCQRCIKRNIGHLCHDEPRDTPTRKSKGGETDSTGTDEPISPKNGFTSQPRLSVSSTIDEARQPSIDGNGMELRTNTVDARPMSNHEDLSQPSGLTANAPAQFEFGDQWLGSQNEAQGVSNFHLNYMFNANEVSDEYNLFNDFLTSSIYDESGLFSVDAFKKHNDPSFPNSMNVSMTGSSGELLANTQANNSASSVQDPAVQGPIISRPGSVKPVSDKARDKYYMTAADPAGTDSPEERMNKLLKAKYDAGLLQPFNYVHGYSRLNKYMEKNMKPSSRHKILMQLDRFRPKFRERMQSLTDIELVLVEMWFERSLMEYDRIFASMAIPACCWRRTGEIFRGNKEMAELIHVPIESLRDGKLSIHDFIVEDQLVSYWEKFCAICFDQQQKAMLTSCTLRSLAKNADHEEIPCCFSFTIRRDNHNIPSLIVGNFLPSGVVKKS